MRKEIRVGDMLWVKIKGANNDYGYGEVVEVWYEENIGNCFNFFCQVNGGLRMGEEKNIIDKVTARMTSKLFEERKLSNEALKNKRR